MARKRNSITLRRRLRIAVRLLPLLVFAVLCYLQFRTLSRFSPTVPPCDDSSRRAPVDDLVGRLRASVTFLPLRDTRKRAGEWFISALNDSSEPEGEAKNLVLPSAASSGRVLCVHAPPRSDAAYALAWRDALPRGAALRPGLTFVSEMSYDYRNLWHGLSALVPFASWHARSGCRAAPARWALFLHGAAVRTGTSGWLASLAEAATGAEMSVETFLDAADGPACFEEAVVFRRQMEGLSRARLLGAFDFLRCKARARCGVAGAASGAGPPALRVRLLSATDVLVTPHGAQLTNLLFMDRNSSVVEFYPLGWRQRAGGGQFVYRWMADRAGMRHEGSWWDPHGEPCPGSPDILSCYKNRQIGHDEAYFARWAARVFVAAKERKTRRGGEALEEERQPEVADCGSS
ncbi:hypothetical protein C2845_PM14G15340 [Panicum miliaceum]|uniref:Uncharacterized protein n=1 Tax=Panicum miliaceum TaxID=4540 RepID=A0A3L6PMT3_PANMI|nr:hypothetical protein C2845_PM14G15340 [Panicum miliaceum]